MRKLLTYFVIVLLLPIMIVGFVIKMDDQPLDVIDLNHDLTIRVFRTNDQVIERVDLEDYIIGVVASEMPASFEFEALKAQAVASRTYVLKRLDPNKNYDVTDDVNYQVYKDEEQLKKIWGNDYSKNLEKITKAVKDTKGEILTYENKLIDAFYFSSTNGYTVNSEEYWASYQPYLRTVASTWDTMISPYNNVEVTMSKTDFLKKLKLSGSSINITNLKRTSSNRVETITINKKKFSGREVRELLGLNSTDFTIRVATNVTITSNGYGHGVGMSQYGAHGMALEGFTYDEILKYYYQNVTIKKIK